MPLRPASFVRGEARLVSRAFPRPQFDPRGEWLLILWVSLKLQSGQRRSLRRSFREKRKVATAALYPYRPLLAQIIPMRRCNLACAYCNEYDATSEPVPTAEMLRRVEHLSRLGTAVVTISGGEPLLHPELTVIIGRIHDLGMVSTLITNGYLLTVKQIEQLGEAGLDRLQVSIDNVNPDEVSKKSLKVLDSKLVRLAKHARFEVNINVVVGAGVAHPEDALTIARRALDLGFTSTMGVIHDHTGHLKALGPAERRVFDTFQHLTRFSLTRFNNTFQTNLAAGKPNPWKCRAGSRFLYICEEGLVHYCSQQRGYPGTPLEAYGLDDIKRAYHEPKACAPFCTIACVHQASAFDRFRDQQAAHVFHGAEHALATEARSGATNGLGQRRLDIVGQPAPRSAAPSAAPSAPQSAPQSAGVQ